MATSRPANKHRSAPVGRVAAERPEVRIPELYQIVIECSGEAEQQQVYERMRKEGFRCRVLTL